MSTGIARTPIQRYDKTANLFSGIPFETYLNNWAMYIRGESDYSRDLTQAAVTMHIRSRGVTISDMCSNYGTRPETNGQWLPYDANLDGEVHPINIIGPAIATNKNACLQSNSTTEVKSANQDAVKKQAAMRWQRMADFFERTGWDEAKRGFIFDAVQKEGVNLVEVVLKERQKQSVPTVSSGRMGLGVYQCQHCESSGMSQIQEIPEDMEDGVKMPIPCPQCQQPAEAMVSLIEGKSLDENEVCVYDIEDQTIPAFNFTIDTYGAKIGGIQTAGWLQVQRLRDLMWMQTHFPHMTFTGPSLWSYAVQADYALARGRWQYLNQQPRASGWGYGHERYEVREIYLHEDSYTTYRPSEDYEFINADGICTFRIKQGQTIAEAQEELYGENQHGFKFVWNDQRLLSIPTFEKEKLNFRERFSDVHWMRESGSYLSSPNYSIVYIQDDITLLNTLNHNIAARNAVQQVVFDSLAFEKGDFSNEYIGTKNAAMLPDADIRKSVFSLPIPTPSPYLAQQMQWLWGIKDSVSQVTPAMRGETQKGQTYGAQHEALEQSYGGLTSVLKSFAQMKCDVFVSKGKLAKQYFTLEQFQEVGSEFGEHWTEEDVEEMCAMDFDRDLVVSYREGSEMPSTPTSKDIKFFAGLQQLALIPPEVALQVITPDKWAKIVERLGAAGDMGFDVSGLEIDEMVAQKRYNDLAEICQQYAAVSFDEIEQARTTVVSMTPPTPEVQQQSAEAAQNGDVQSAQQMMQGTPVTALDLKTEEIFHQAQIRFSQYEDLSQQQDFFIEMLRGEIGKTKPNYMLIEMLQFLLGGLEQAQQQISDEKMANDPQVKAAAQADAMAKDDAEKAHQLEAAKLEQDGEIKKTELAIKQKDLEIKAHDADRSALIDVAKHVDTQENEMPEAAEPEEEPIDKISIAYGDLPPSGQQQVLENAGIKVSKTELAAKQKADSKPKPVAGKPATKPAKKK